VTPTGPAAGTAASRDPAFAVSAIATSEAFSGVGSARIVTAFLCGSAALSAFAT
jgi:hypothetical protein